MEPPIDPFRRRTLGLLAAVALGALGCVRAEGAGRPLRFGIQPFRTAEVLLTLHKRLLDTLAQALGRPLRFSTRPTYDAYTKALLAGEFDLAIMPPHIAVWLAGRGDWELEAKYEVRLAALLVGRDAAPAPEAEALRTRFRAALLSFHETEAGRRFFADTGYRRFVPITEADFAEMAPFLPDLDRRYASPPELSR